MKLEIHVGHTVLSFLRLRRRVCQSLKIGLRNNIRNAV
jgi:hypothetical protein